MEGARDPLTGFPPACWKRSAVPAAKCRRARLSLRSRCPRRPLSRSWSRKPRLPRPWAQAIAC